MVSAIASGQEPSGQRYFDIPAQPIATALLSFSEQADVQLLVDARLTEGRRSDALIGHFAPMDALNRLLDGHGLEVRIVADRTVAISAVRSIEPPPRSRFRDDDSAIHKLVGIS